MLLCCYVVVLLCYYVMLLCYYVVKLCCYVVMLLCCYVIMLLSCYVIMLLCCYVVMLLCCYVVMLLHEMKKGLVRLYQRMSVFSYVTLNTVTNDHQSVWTVPCFSRKICFVSDDFITSLKAVSEFHDWLH
jgi:hypothetical protein